MGGIRRHLSYANVMATLAVFLVLGGGTAIALGGKNTVQSDDLGPGPQVKAPDVADGAIDSEDIANASILYDDLSRGASGGRAWGRVSAGGTLRFGSKNVTNVSHPQEGIYCITVGTNINPVSAVMIVGTDRTGSDTSTGAFPVVQWNSDASCDSQSMVVRTAVWREISNDGQLETENQPFAFVVP
jgi:hypothetical protein